MSKLTKYLDFAQIIIYIMIAFVLVTYVVLVVWYWQNKYTTTLTPPKQEQKQEQFTQKYLDESLYCEKDSDCTWQKNDCGGCSCPEPINKANLTDLDCTEYDPSLRCALACETKNLKCINNSCVAFRSGDDIAVSYPWPGNTVKNNFTITGQAKGTWFFEGSFPIEIYDRDDNLILQSYVTAQSDWMTSDWVPFEANVSISTEAKNGYIIFKKDNPSGLPEYDDSYYVHIRFSQDTLDSINIDDWETYNKDSLGFSFQYPADFLITDEIFDAPYERSVYMEKDQDVIYIGQVLGNETITMDDLEKGVIDEMVLYPEDIKLNETIAINDHQYHHLEIFYDDEPGKVLIVYSSILDDTNAMFVDLYFDYKSDDDLVEIRKLAENILNSIEI